MMCWQNQTQIRCNNCFIGSSNSCSRSNTRSLNGCGSRWSWFNNNQNRNSCGCGWRRNTDRGVRIVCDNCFVNN